MEIPDKYARPFANHPIRLIAPLLALLGASLTYAQLTVAPSALTFTVHAGGPAPGPQTIAVSGTSGTPFIIVPSIGLSSFLTASVEGSVLEPGALQHTPAIITVSVIWPPAAGVLGYSGSIEIYQFDPSTGDTSTTGVEVPVSLSITPAVPPPPSITPGGIVPVDSTVNTIQSGEWVSIYGSNLASSTVSWNGNFPMSLGGTSVTIDGKAAYLSYVNPNQINLQAPDDPATGPVPVVIATLDGTSTSTVRLAQFAPSFLLLDSNHVAGIILRSNGSGAYGGGTYDIIGPTGNSLGYATVPAKAGDTVELFAGGLGPTNPEVHAGEAFSGAAPTTNPVGLFINNVTVSPTFAGLSSAGVYQINLTLPADLGTGDVSLQASVGGSQTHTGVVISLQ